MKTRHILWGVLTAVSAAYAYNVVQNVRARNALRDGCGTYRRVLADYERSKVFRSAIMTKILAEDAPVAKAALRRPLDACRDVDGRLSPTTWNWGVYYEPSSPSPKTMRSLEVAVERIRARCRVAFDEQLSMYPHVSAAEPARTRDGVCDSLRVGWTTAFRRPARRASVWQSAWRISDTTRDLADWLARGNLPNPQK